LQTFKPHAPTLRRPFFALLEQDCADQPRNGAFVGEMPTTLVRRLTLAFSRFSGLVEWTCSQCARGKSMQTSTSCSVASISLAILGKRSRCWSATTRQWIVSQRVV